MRRRSGFGWMECIEGVLLLGLGSYTFAQPDRALTGFIVMYGIVAVTMGIVDILLYVRVERFTGFGPIVSLISGALSVMTGVMLLVYPNRPSLRFSRPPHPAALPGFPTPGNG